MSPDQPLPSATLAMQPSATSLVPAGFAEKAMASLMQLHGELMDEKERRVDLYRRLMEKEQTVSELRTYIRTLEEKLGIAAKEAVPAAAPATFTTQRAEKPAPQSATPVQAQAAAQKPVAPTVNVQRAAPKPRPAAAPLVHSQISREAVEGWKAW